MMETLKLINDIFSVLLMTIGCLGAGMFGGSALVIMHKHKKTDDLQKEAEAMLKYICCFVTATFFLVLAAIGFISIILQEVIK